MNCRIVDLRNKDVINIHDGTRLGYVGDVEVDTCTAKLISLIIYGQPKCFGLLGHEDDCIINWNDIEVIGEDTILVNCRRKRPVDRRCDDRKDDCCDDGHRGDHRDHDKCRREDCERCDRPCENRRCGFVESLLGRDRR